MSLQVREGHTRLHLYFHTAWLLSSYLLKIAVIYCSVLVLAQFSKVAVGKSFHISPHLFPFIAFPVASRCFWGETAFWNMCHCYCYCEIMCLLTTCWFFVGGAFINTLKKHSEQYLTTWEQWLYKYNYKTWCSFAPIKRCDVFNLYSSINLF